MEFDVQLHFALNLSKIYIFCYCFRINSDGGKGGKCLGKGSISKLKGIIQHVGKILSLNSQRNKNVQAGQNLFEISKFSGTSKNFQINLKNLDKIKLSKIVLMLTFF